jgi:hypothetical protein
MNIDEREVKLHVLLSSSLEEVSYEFATWSSLPHTKAVFGVYFLPLVMVYKIGLDTILGDVM